MCCFIALQYHDGRSKHLVRVSGTALPCYRLKCLPAWLLKLVVAAYFLQVVDFTGGDPVVLRRGQGDVSAFEE